MCIFKNVVSVLQFSQYNSYLANWANYQLLVHNSTTYEMSNHLFCVLLVLLTVKNVVLCCAKEREREKTQVSESSERNRNGPQKGKLLIGFLVLLVGSSEHKFHTKRFLPDQLPVQCRRNSCASMLAHPSFGPCLVSLGPLRVLSLISHTLGGGFGNLLKRRTFSKLEFEYLLDW